jgi:hypothetical protein
MHVLSSAVNSLSQRCWSFRLLACFFKYFSTFFTIAHGLPKWTLLLLDLLSYPDTCVCSLPFLPGIWYSFLKRN